MVAVYRTIGGSFSETVTAKPAVAAYDTAAGEALRVEIARTDSGGTYTFDLPCADQVDPAGVYWTVFEPGGNQITILVPTSDVPVPPGGWLVDDIRVVGPDDPASVIVGVNPDVYARDLAATDAALAARLVAASNLSDLASKPTARTNLGLGTAATHPVGDFDVAGAAAAAVAAEQTRADSVYVPRFATAPDHTIYPAYVDTSTTPPVVKGWNGSAFVAIGGASITDNGDGTLSA